MTDRNDVVPEADHDAVVINGQFAAARQAIRSAAVADLLCTTTAAVVHIGTSTAKVTADTPPLTESQINRIAAILRASELEEQRDAA